MKQPEYVNKVGGWATDIINALWPGVPEADQMFTNLNQRVINEVKFPCVIFAKYDFGIVAIDCNDCDTYEVDDPSIVIYIKLQYNPKHQYKQKVYPFTFVPQKTAFTLDLAYHKSKYNNTPKLYQAWGRFIAVSLDRFHISHAMGKLGIPGGAYVLSEGGYGDHYLDPIKPRQRMSFDEYVSHMYKSMAIIDACGFGDFTHRVIETLAIGIPLIRPKFINTTADPLIAGVHYLDCGHKGENLKECVDAVQNSRLRNNLIQSGLEWYDRNCTIQALQNILESIINKHHTVPKAPSIVTTPVPKYIDNPKFDLLIGLYRDKSDDRVREVAETLTFNLSDEMINKIHVFWEDPTSLDEAVKIIPELKHEKINLIMWGKRLFFADLFKYANDNLSRTIIANNDIYFGNLSKLVNYDLKGRILCLSRWDVSKHAVPKYMDCDCSQDAWIFQTPINIEAKFHLGWWGCDGRINREATEAGLLVSNPSFDILAYHNHPSGVRNYDSFRDNVPDGCGVPPSKLIWSKSVTPLRLEQLAWIEFSDDIGYIVHTLIDGMSSHMNASRRFTTVPPELYGLRYNMTTAHQTSAMKIKCLATGVVYILVARDWNGGIKKSLQQLGATPTNLVVNSDQTVLDVWRLVMLAAQEIVLPVQATLVCESMRRV